jgi:hypothetical protein
VICRFTTFDKLMILIRVLFWTFIIVMAYRFLFRFVIPIFQATRVASARLRQMQQQMNDMQNKANPKPGNTAPPQMKEGDYIEYEEVK